MLCTFSRYAAGPARRSITHPRLSAPLFSGQRFLQSYGNGKQVPPLAFAFDIDGVLVRGSQRLPRAKEALTYLQEERIPFILLTNGGGYHEEKRASALSEELDVKIDPTMVVQSHTPFTLLDQYKKGTVLVVGGEYDNCRPVAHKYGFANVVTPSDILAQHPEIWQFSSVFSNYHKGNAKPLPRVIDASHPDKTLKIDAIFVYNDPRDWGLDITVIIDCLLSQRGLLGTLSPKNNDTSLPNRGFLQDGQPPLYFSNPDLWFASDFALPRMGQGGFREALEGVWQAVTGHNGVELKKTVIGKPYRETYLFAEKKLQAHREALFGVEAQTTPLRHVFMVGDNPESDIRGAMTYKSELECEWHAALLRTGVYSGGKPSCEPSIIVDDVYDAVQWAVKKAGWK